MNAFIGESYKKSASAFLIVCLVYFGMGVSLAFGINYLSSTAEKSLELDPYKSVLLQVMLIIVVLYVIQIHISPQFGADWQKTTPGFIFTGSIFLFQPQLTRNLADIFSKWL